VTLVNSSFATGLEDSLEVVVHTGVAAIAPQVPQLEALAAAVPGTPITARWPWASVCVVDPIPGHTPWLLTLRSGEDLVGAALLIDDDTGSVRRTTLAGTADGHRGALLAVNDAAAAGLGAALGNALMTQLREFTVGPVGPGTCRSAWSSTTPPSPWSARVPRWVRA
jgi:hypothetical protein